MSKPAKSSIFGWTVDEINDSKKFPNGCFKAIYKPSPDTTDSEVLIFNKLSKDINKLAQNLGTAADRSKPYPERKNQIRVRRLAELRKLTEQLEKGEIDGYNALKDYSFIDGTYYAMSNAVPKLEAATLNSTKDESADLTKNWSLKFEPLPKEATTKQIGLSIEIQKAYDVVDLVMDRRRTGRANVSGKLNDLVTPISKQSLTLRKRYVQQLKEIADEGLLSQELTAYAARKLDLFKHAFVQREADRVKSLHVKALGYWAAIFAAVFLACAALIQIFGDLDIESGTFVNKITSFLILATGACVGTWLSFTLRKVELSFDDLILLEPDRLNPAARIIFVVLLTCVIGGIMQLGWVEVSLGDESLKPVGNTFGTPLMIGTLCGIAERSLAGAVAGRAESVAVMVGNSTQSNGDR